MAKRAEKDLIREIGNVYGALSPENLHCDGEISRAAAKRKEKALTKRLGALFTELGREVSEMEVYEFEHANSKCPV